MACEYIYKGTTYSSKEEFISKVIPTLKNSTLSKFDKVPTNKQVYLSSIKNYEDNIVNFEKAIQAIKDNNYKIILPNNAGRYVASVESEGIRGGTIPIAENPYSKEAKEGKFDKEYALSYLKERIEREEGFIENENRKIKEIEKVENDIYNKNINSNQFLQLLNKDNNWVTFFIKAIIQDSAKKGYEKVLFPSGRTASLIEGHETIEEFIKDKQERLELLKDRININRDFKIELNEFDNTWEVEDKTSGELILSSKQDNPEGLIEKAKEEVKKRNQNEITQLEKEIEDAKAGRLKISTIADFYESTIFNVLKKHGYNPSRITDEYGNTWNEVEIESERDLSTVFFQLANQDSIYNTILEKAQNIIKKPSETKKDENGAPVDAYFYKGVEMARRVTDKAKDQYQRWFGDRNLTRNEYEKAVDTLKAEKGTAAHADIQHAFSVLVKDGVFQPNARFDEAYIPLTSKIIYKTLFENLQERLASYGNAKFLSEVSVVDESGKGIAGTIDFLAIKEDGTVEILDWKFYDINTDRYEDVPWFKQKAWNIQIGEYKRILSDKYGIPTYKIKGQAIPIKTHYKFTRATKEGKRELPTLESIEIGNVNVKTEERDYLLPVTLAGQDTGNQEINKLLSKLNALHKNIEDVEVISKEDKARKTEQLQYLDRAIRQLAVKQIIEPLIIQADIYTKDIDNLIALYENTWKDMSIDIFKNKTKEISDFGKKLNIALEQISIYTNLDIELKNTDFAEQIENISFIARNARFLESKLLDINSELAEKIANAENIEDIIKAEPSVVITGRLLTETSKLPVKTIQVLYRQVRDSLNKAFSTTNEENTKLKTLGEEYEKLAKSKGLNTKNLFSLIMDYKKNKLIDEFKGDFYKELKKAVKDKDFSWIKENVNISEYKTKLAEHLKNDIELINSRPWTDEEKENQINKKKLEYSLEYEDSPGWYLHYNTLRGFPIKDKWTSEEWKTLNSKGYEAAKNLYTWIREINEKAAEVGYIPDNKSARTFLPYVVKSFAEKLIFGGNLTVGESFIRSMTVDEDTVGYGAIDKFTGKPILKIPKYFTKATDKDLSTNLIKNLGLFNQALNRYKFISEVEGQALILSRLERNKNSILTNEFGRAIFNKEYGVHEESQDNHINADLFDNQMASLIYGQKYIQSAKFDQLLGRVGESFEKVNKTLGVKVLPEGLSERQFSLNKSIDTLNRWFQQKTLGLNPLPALSNLIGGELQLAINSGKYFTKTDILKAKSKIAEMAVKTEEGKKFVAALKYFLPFVNDEQNRQLLEKLSVTKLTEHSLQDFLMSLMRGGDLFIQAIVFSSVLDNSILVDGKIYNVREYIRKNTEYKDRYESGQLKEQEEKFESLVREYLDKYGLLKVATLENGELKLPINKVSEEAFKIKNLSQALSKRVTGNLTPADKRGINQSIWGDSFMVFKNWIPSLWDVRFGKMKFASDIDAFEWGRSRTVARIIGFNAIQALASFTDAITFNTLSLSKTGQIVKGTPEGLKYLQELYEFKQKQYFEQTGQKLELSAEDFYDMVRQNIRQQAKDTLITLSFLGMFLAAKALPPDDDEDQNTKNVHKFLVRTLDKLSDEVSFYYLPTSMQSMLNGSVMPSIGVFSDGVRTINSGFTELYGNIFDEEVAEKNYFIKNLAKTFPITSQMSSYMPLYAPDLAKELGIKLGTQARK